MTRCVPYQAKQRRVRLVDLLAAGLAASSLSLGGCSQQIPIDKETPTSTPAPKADTRQDELTEIIVFGQSSWFLVIRATGNGTYGFGDGGPPYGASVPRGTFDLGATHALVVAASVPRDAAATTRRTSEEGWYSVAIGRRGRSSTEVLDTRDAKLIRSLFERAMATAPPTPEMAQVLQARPPFPG